MKLHSLLLATCFSMLTAIGFAGNIHSHKSPNDKKVNPAVAQQTQLLGCEIELMIDWKATSVWVYGFFDDNTALRPFLMKWYDKPHYISLWYNGYCHAGMLLYIETDDYTRNHVFSGYVPVNSSINIQKIAATKGLQATISQKS